MDVLNGHTGHNLHPDFGTTYRGRYIGIPLNIISGSQVAGVAVHLTTYARESDPIPVGGLPIPTTVIIEGDPGPFDPNADNHCLILDTDTLGRVVISQLDGGLTHTAYALLSDLITIRRRAAGVRP